MGRVVSCGDDGARAQQAAYRIRNEEGQSRMTRITLCGVAGRMGTEISRALKAQPDMALVLGVEAKGHCAVGSTIDGAPVVDDLRAGFRACDVIVDFAAPPAAQSARIAAEKGVAFITGTTGLDEVQQAELKQAAKCIPLLYASNMSMGITAAGALLRTAVRWLPGYDVEIMEMHHRRKQDAPSGTALRLAGIVREAQDELKALHGRVGETGGRSGHELGIHALRGGDVVGEHHVIFAGPGERLVITHIADNRMAFVAGVLAGVRFIIGRSPGLYGMEDVLGIRAQGSG